MPAPGLATRLLRLPRRAIAFGRAALCALALASPQAAGAAEDALRVKVAGGLGGVQQYQRFELPFWTQRVPQITNGRLRAEIAPYDRSGIRGQELLQLLRLGVLPFGTVPAGLAAADEPELNAVDLPVLSPTIESLRRTVDLLRPQLTEMLRDRYGVELLAIYTYPAQVLLCDRPFAGLGDLQRRRIRTSSVSQSELVAGLGAMPVVIPFAEITSAVRNGVVECAITGALSARSIRLHEVMTHVAGEAINWGVTYFGANVDAWAALPAEVRDALIEGLAALERDIWQSAEHETREGLLCLTGRTDCPGGGRGSLVAVPPSPADEARRIALLRDVVLPGWIGRCGTECAQAWNQAVGPSLGVRAEAQ